MITIDWPNYAITVPQAYLTPLGGGVFQLDVEAFRNDLRALEASADGMPWPNTHLHVTPITQSGVTYARFVSILSPYTVEFEDVGSPYTVAPVGGNHNFGDVKVVNQVSLIIGNSAGLIVVTTGSGLSSAQDSALMAINPNLEVINIGVQKASILVPHTEDL